MRTTRRRALALIAWAAALAAVAPPDTRVYRRAAQAAPARGQGPFLSGRFPAHDPWAQVRLVPAFPELTFKDAIGLEAPPRGERLYVYTRQGQVWAFSPRARRRRPTLVLDLSHRCQGYDDSGLLGLAFHPDFGRPGSPHRGHLFVWYSHSEAPTAGPRRPPGRPRAPLRNRLARFSIPDGAVAADPASELVLIDQLDRTVWMNGGGLFFHPRDGFLYVANGDEGEPQRIDGDLFGGVLRIDVSCDPARSRPIRRQPARGRTAHYCIPNDNPFVGEPGALEEFYALGLRNPHRVTVDPPTGRIFAGDVGEKAREEVNLIEAGGNYGWPFREGSLTVGAAPAALVGREIAPLVEIAHPRMESIAGGYVYRGRALPALAGRYVFGDWNGDVYALDVDAPPPRVPTWIARVPATSSASYAAALAGFGVDRDGELYLLQMGDAGRIWKLAPAPVPDRPLPSRLSATGAFLDLATLAPAPGVLPYDVNVPLWSDGAGKRRFIALPHTRSGRPSAIGFSRDGEWSFPDGTVFVKHFARGEDGGGAAAAGALARPLETRFLVRAHDGGAYGATYKWRADGSDADLLTDGLREIPPGDAEVWDYPSPQDCLTCHTPAAGFVLGANTRQWNRAMGGGEAGENQIATFARRGLLRFAPSPAAIRRLPRLFALDDTTATVEARARSYLDANCANCHQPGGVMRGLFDARFTVPLDRAQIIGGFVLDDLGVRDARVIVPGDPARSIARARMASADPHRRMPPLARQLVDTAAVAVIDAWIAALPAVRR